MVAPRLLELRTPSRRLTIVAVSLALGAAGCGGSEVEYQEVPGDPAEITLPDRTPAADATASGTEEDASAEEATPTATATPSDATGTSTDGATTDGATTEEPATAEATPTPAAAAADGETTDEPPVPGSDAERFEDFCAQNAGAC